MSEVTLPSLTLPSLLLEPLPHGYSISKLTPGSPAPDWALGDGCVSVTAVEDETSIVCRSDRVPDGVARSDGWTAVKVTTLFELDEPGVVLAAVKPISQAGLGIFVLSTYYRDYILVRTAEMDRAVRLWTDAGHQIGDQAR
ncbi:ACT domain-containing protein [Rhodospirillaceae bacterium KN72]|uniref:ACT domain-containing protein n=1 Tax=Pacificispira spongiicola TaxID=2729598 RepID=A0A7Y0HD25_9PROT|nr:ACT domain-containing protein [Pacificispira spongiicola]NMM43190.1 ACT domain-containing protein [Pacificispira spongiicola]